MLTNDLPEGAHACGHRVRLFVGRDLTLVRAGLHTADCTRNRDLGRAMTLDLILGAAPAARVPQEVS
jgi:hypothetical protein